jgi:hypothetical protein
VDPEVFDPMSEIEASKRSIGHVVRTFPTGVRTPGPWISMGGLQAW